MYDEFHLKTNCDMNYQQNICPINFPLKVYINFFVYNHEFEICLVILSSLMLSFICMHIFCPKGIINFTTYNLAF